MIKDWNRENLGNYIFHFKNSLRPFIKVRNTSYDSCFVDINEMKVYTYDELEYEELYFYEKEDDDDFKGVKIAGNIKWV